MRRPIADAAKTTRPAKTGASTVVRADPPQLTHGYERNADGTRVAAEPMSSAPAMTCCSIKDARRRVGVDNLETGRVVTERVGQVHHEGKNGAADARGALWYVLSDAFEKLSV